MCIEDRDDQATRARIFISYRHADPDQVLAVQLYDALRARFDVFIDRRIPVGTDWAQRINLELERADFFVVLLSEQSVQSEMVVGELELARDLAAERGVRRPRILPVRVAYADRLPYPLSAYFRHVQWVNWQMPGDTPHVIQRLTESIDDLGEHERAIERGGYVAVGRASEDDGQAGPCGCADEGRFPLPGMWLPASWPPPKGALPLDSFYYIERPADVRARRMIRQQGVTISIRGPRQIGKTSLLVRIADAARAQGRQVAWVDFQLSEKSAFADPCTFYRQLCGHISDALGIDPQIEAHWNDSLGGGFNCERYITRYVLPRSGPLVLAMDEVDRVLEARFSSEFFGMLRSWHDQRAQSDLLRQLDLVLVSSTEPHLWISNPGQSPFTVAERIHLGDFTLDNIRHLNQQYDSPLSEDQLQRLMALVGGHPYLVHYAIYAVASGSFDAEQLFRRALSDDGPFADHLNHLLFRLHGKPELTQSLRRIIDTRICRDERIFYRLSGAGLVRRENEHGPVLPSRQLYATFFHSRLESEPRRRIFSWHW